jgi:RHS repeat-associated protein
VSKRPLRRLVVRSLSWDRPTARIAALGSAGMLAALCLATLALMPASASAESLCTDTWTGPSEGEWQTASDWSASKVPSSSDVACIGSGKTVKVTGGASQAGVVQGEGALAILSTLEVTNSLEASSIHTIVLNDGGTLTGAATVRVTGALEWPNGTMSGSGTTVLVSGASGSKEKSGQVYLRQRTFINEGTFTLQEGSISIEEGAEIKNVGTFTANAEGTVLAASGGGSAPLFVNTGVLQKTAGVETYVDVDFENQGTVNGKIGDIAFSGSGDSVTLTNGSLLEGAVVFSSPTVAGYNFKAPSGTVTLSGGELTIASGSTAMIANFVLDGAGAALAGSGTLDVSGSMVWQSGEMLGSGSTVLMNGASGSKEERGPIYLRQRTLINDGIFRLAKGYISMEEGAKIKNVGTFTANAEGTVLAASGGGSAPLFVNIGTFQKTEGIETYVSVSFQNLGVIKRIAGKILFMYPFVIKPTTQRGRSKSRSHPTCGDPVSCATGNFSETQTDLSIGGRGVGLELARTYNSQAGAEGIHGAFGYGWTSSFSDHLVVEKSGKETTLYQAEGNTVPFTEISEGAFVAPAWSQDTLSGSAEAGYTLTLADQTKYKFNGSSGRLESVTDRDGNATTLAYNEAGRLETITDPAGRKMTLTYNSEGLVESAKDPMGHVVEYTYESGNLTSVTEPGEEKARWQFKYNGSHELTTMTDGRGRKTVNEYNGSNQVISQTDPAERTLTFEYEPFHTVITNHSTGSVTSEWFTSNDEPFSITQGYETSSETTASFTYNEGGYVTSETDGDGYTTTYGYDSANDQTSLVDPDKDETKWTYDSTHDVETMTTPKGETTTFKRESHGNPEVIERPAPGGKTQITKYKYGSHGEVESMTDPLERTWKYEYDSKGDRTSETDPEGDKRTWEYNEDSQEIATVSPRGNVKGAEVSKFTTKIERDRQGRPLTITDPLGHTTKYTYDGDGNIETVTDGNGHKTTYTYNGDDQQIRAKEANGTITETEYDGAGRVIGQTDGNKHTTKYVRNPVGEVVEIIDPLGRKTTKEYDLAGNLTKLTDPEKRATTYTYDPANRLTEVSYSDGKTPTVKYEYDADGDRTKMTDGTGTTTYTYDQLDRLTETEDGHKETVKYEYDLANEQTKITYPNGKAVTRAYDNAGRLDKVTDWDSNVTNFVYDADSDETAIAFPSETKDEDRYAYNDADQMTEVTMLRGAATLASLVYTRDSDGQIKSTTSKGLPGPEVTENTYDENNRLTKSGSTEYKYDAADNPTTEGSSTNTYNEADELEKGTGETYSYNGLGERTKATPEKGPATTYGYDQAGNLISVERPKEGETSEIKDTFTYDGDDLRASKTKSGTTTYMAWDTTEGLPLVLSDTTNSYIYGPGGLPIEQITSEGTVIGLHHDQQGSTRLLTGTEGTVAGTTTFDAYGNKTGSTGSRTTPLGYDGQYTSTDTGLIYLRARVYDPASAQFLSVDPASSLTRQPYPYANDNPLNFGDPSGLASQYCAGGTLGLGLFTIETNTCIVVTPSGTGITVSAGGSGGVGFGGNIHAGAGASNAQTPEEYGGLFFNAGGSAEYGFGGYFNTFLGPGESCHLIIFGGTAGPSVGFGADLGMGGSYTFVIPV